jgi:hypothetical protein
MTNLAEPACEALHWIFTAEDRNQWQVLVDSVMNLHIS